MSKETAIQSSIVDALKKMPYSVVIRINNIGIFDDKKKIRRKSVNPQGISDLLYIFKGRSVFIEVKSEKEYKYIKKNYDKIKNGLWPVKSRNQHYKNQILFIEKSSEKGIPGFFTSTIDDTMKKLSSLWQDFQNPLIV